MLPQLMSKVASNPNIVRVVVGTKYDQFMKSQVAQRELEEFSAHWKVPVFRTSNIGSGSDILLGVSAAVQNASAAVSAQVSVLR